MTEAGRRAVYVSYQSYPNSAPDATYTVNHLGGSSQVVVNQRMGGGTWVYIGTYPFAAGLQEKPLVTLTNMSEDDDAVVSADAVKVGGGMGFVARGGSGEYAVSGYPAYLEGSRYYLQGAGFPTWVYDTPDGDDYIDDYKSRALWVNHMAGGSEMFPDTIGLGIPVDMALAFHTDAGFHTDSTTVGTLGLYSTDDGNPLGNGTSRYANRDLTDDITVMSVAKSPDIFTYSQTELDADAAWEVLAPALKAAGTAFSHMRRAEGEKIQRDLYAKLDSVAAWVGEVESLSRADTVGYRDKLEARLRALFEDRNVTVDENRLLTECAVFADRIAVDEEITRLRAHIGAFHEIAEEPAPAGKKLDFLMQEMNRETNTIGSKCNNLEISTIVVNMKAEIEKIREQVQNIE